MTCLPSTRSTPSVWTSNTRSTVSGDIRRTPSTAAAAGQRRVDAGDGAGVARPASGRDLGGAPGASAGHGGVQGATGHGAGGDGVGVDGLRKRVRGGRDQLRDAAVVRGVEADVEVGAERLRHLAAEERAQRHAGDALQDLALQLALRDRVVAGGRPRLPPGRLPGQRGGDAAAVVEVLRAGSVGRSRRGRRCGSSRAGRARPACRSRRTRASSRRRGRRSRAGRGRRA